MFQINDKVKFIPEMVAGRWHLIPCLDYVGCITSSNNYGAVLVHFEHSGYPMPVDFVAREDQLMLVEATAQSA